MTLTEAGSSLRRFRTRALIRGLWPLLFLFTSASACSPGTEEGGDGAGPDALVEEWVAMWSSYDLDQVEELFLDDPRLTYFSSEKEGVIRGKEALLKHHRGFGFLPGGESRASRLWLDSVATEYLPSDSL